MVASPDTALEQLERATAELLAADPEDFATLEKALNERSQAISSIQAAEQLESSLDLSAFADRLRAALEAGAKVSHKLRLVRAAAQAALARTRRERFVLDALSSTRVEPRRVDCRG